MSYFNNHHMPQRGIIPMTTSDSRNWLVSLADAKEHLRVGHTDDDAYITIETSVKPKPKETLDCKSRNRHKMIHTLLLCYNHYWQDLQYVKSRTPYEQIEHYSQCDD